MGSDDEFHVGYAATLPAAVASHVRRVVAGLAVVAVALPLLLLAAQERFAPAAFEFGVTRTYRGTVHALPVPRLVLARPASRAAAAVSQLLLVAPGKHGAAPDAAPLDGQPVELAGTLIYRAGRTMLEIMPGSLRPLGATARLEDPVAEDLGTWRLRGEIVDTKCHLGVMRPGDGKTHRDCAARCLSGGVPAALHVVDGDGISSHFLLLGDDGRTINRELLDRVAEPVEVAGRVERRGDLLFLYAEPEAVRRLGEAEAS